MAARQARHAFLARAARRRRLGTVVLAHHADDQIELFFVRLLRGAGRQGLAGMKWRSPSPADPALHLIRPLLGCTRADLAAFATSQRIPFREDRTNASLDILRNRIRNQLLPLLTGSYQPALGSILLREMELLGTEEDWMADCARAWRAKPAAEPFGQLPVALQRILLRDALTQRGVEPEFGWVEHLRLHPGQAIMITPLLLVVHEGDGTLRRVQPPRSRASTRRQVVRLAGEAGSGQFDELTWSWRISPLRKTPLNRPQFGPGQEWFDADRVGAEVVLRHWHPGDRFQPSGLVEAVKLQDLFTNRKIPKAWRHRLTVATTAQGEIWWVEGLRIAQPFKLQPGTRRALRWSWSRVGAGPGLLGAESPISGR
jgi:tRNA(Ile)-lysidine synthase